MPADGVLCVPEHLFLVFQCVSVRLHVHPQGGQFDFLGSKKNEGDQNHHSRCCVGWTRNVHRVAVCARFEQFPYHREHHATAQHDGQPGERVSQDVVSHVGRAEYILNDFKYTVLIPLNHVPLDVTNEHFFLVVWGMQATDFADMDKFLHSEVSAQIHIYRFVLNSVLQVGQLALLLRWYRLVELLLERIL